ncbi:hypothetical protein [Candidatus Mycoplasma haematohominis]|uniref:Uncharacterized protein n=1 Tax=Candidatus Mycoplasma haematohominis TaxID=1494318 RepID=A0A478FRC7_9MOLU|nr:hypothetical protein [Candidatus Mycoplasma haemohominis]GCE63574.1 hypothetical protein MHSWG343_05710 [Candidatus Mycoplasma haemohominis]
MNVPAKVAAGTAVAIGGTTGGYFLFNREYGEPPFTVEQRSTSYANSTFGKTNAKYLVDPDNSRNEEWWNEKYKVLFSKQSESDATSKLSTEFQKTAITSGYGTGNNALNKVCDVAFKEQTTSWNTKQNYEDNVWTYCSLLEGKPKLLTESDHKDKLGGAHKDKAVLAKNDDNSKFWELRNKEFFGKGEYSGEHATGSIFKGLYGKKGQEKPGTIKEKCEEAYGSDKNQDSSSIQASDKDIKMFCYLIPVKEQQGS